MNCTGGCSWKIFVKNGLVSFEMQQTDYPRVPATDLPNHEPRGCQRGASFSWYLYSPHRIKHPMIRGRLLDLYRAERKSKGSRSKPGRRSRRPAKREKYVHVRGLGGFVRTNWDEGHRDRRRGQRLTHQEVGPGPHLSVSRRFPAMSMISYAAGARYLSLIGGACGRSTTGTATCRPRRPRPGASRPTCRAADWYNSTYLIITGANLPMTRTPDAHFATEVRYKGTKIVSMAPDYAEYVKFADLWMPVKQGTDAAAFLAMGHVALKEFPSRSRTRTSPSTRASTRPADAGRAASQVNGEGYVSDRNLRAPTSTATSGESQQPRVEDHRLRRKEPSSSRPTASIGFRWGEDGKWNLLEERRRPGRPRSRTHLHRQPGWRTVVSVGFPHFVPGRDRLLYRNVPARRLKLANGESLVTSVFDLQVAQYGIDRGLGGGNVATPTTTPMSPTPRPGLPRSRRQGRRPRAHRPRVRRERLEDQGQVHGDHGRGDQPLVPQRPAYRSIMNLLHMCGCVGQTGGGWAHYVARKSCVRRRLGADRVRSTGSVRRAT